MRSILATALRGFISSFIVCRSSSGVLCTSFSILNHDLLEMNVRIGFTVVDGSKASFQMVRVRQGEGSLKRLTQSKFIAFPTGNLSHKLMLLTLATEPN